VVTPFGASCWVSSQETSSGMNSSPNPMLISQSTTYAPTRLIHGEYGGAPDAP
jgi:hypothetical protein